MLWWVLIIGCVTALQKFPYIAIGQLVQGNRASELRIDRFRKQMDSFGIPFEHVIGQKSRSDRIININTDWINMLEKLKHSDYEQGILCDDDTEFHPNFIHELELGIQAAGNYSILTLCAGNLWGRITGRNNPIGALAFDDELTNNETDPAGRVYLQWPRFKTRIFYNSDAIWPGAPLCHLIKNDPQVISMVQDAFRSQIRMPSDYIMRNVAIVNPSMKALAYPQLCRENEFDGKV